MRGSAYPVDVPQRCAIGDIAFEFHLRQRQRRVRDVCCDAFAVDRLHARIEFTDRNVTRRRLHEPGSELGGYRRIACRRADDRGAFSASDVDRYGSHRIDAMAERRVAHMEYRAQGSTIRVAWPKSVTCFR